MDDLRKRIEAAIEAEGVAVDLAADQWQFLIDGILSEVSLELDDLRHKLRAAHKEHGKVSTRLYLARLELKEAQSRLHRTWRQKHAGSEGWSFYVRLLRDLMHAIDPGLHDGPLKSDLEKCLALAQRHRHAYVPSSDEGHVHEQ